MLDLAGTTAFANSTPALDLPTIALQHPSTRLQLAAEQPGLTITPELFGSSNHGTREHDASQANTAAFAAPVIHNPAVLHAEGSNDWLLNTLGDWPRLSMVNPLPMYPRAPRHYEDTAATDGYSNTMTNAFSSQQLGVTDPSFTASSQQVSSAAAAAATAARSEISHVQSDSELTTATRSSGSGTDSAERSNAISIDSFAEKFTLHPPQKAVKREDQVKDLMELIREYPRLMLQKDFWSPYIHHRMYRCAQFGMAEPLGIALVCVSSHLNAVQSSIGFVNDMIDLQRHRLISEFRAHHENLETALAGLHAMCMYQTIGMLEETDLRERSSIGRHQGSGMPCNNMTAELNQSFLLKVGSLPCALYALRVTRYWLLSKLLHVTFDHSIARGTRK